VAQNLLDPVWHGCSLHSVPHQSPSGSWRSRSAGLPWRRGGPGL